MDFFGDVFGASASKALLEGLNRVVGDSLSAQDWFAPKESQEAPVCLPWQALTPEEKGYERSTVRCSDVCMLHWFRTTPHETIIIQNLHNDCRCNQRQLREAVLLISQSPQVFLQDAPAAATELPADIFASAGAVLEADDGLRQLRFRLVPKYCSEEQFWNRYFAAVERVKQQVKTEQMWGDFDMLDDDVIEAGGAGSSSSQVELPSMRQAGNATDTMSNMVLSGQSSASAHTLDRSEKPKPPAVHSSRPVRIRCKQTSKAEAADSGLERMVMSGDLGSQASSLTEALLMSPRSMDSSATKVLASLPSPGGPSPMGPSPMGLSLTGALPVGASPTGPFPLSPVNTIPHPLSPASNPDRTEGAPAPGHASEGTHRLGPDLLQSGGAKGGSGSGSGSGSGVPWLGNTDQSVVYGGAGLSLPFKAASLQQLANAALTSKKVETMQQLVSQCGANSKSGGGDRAATAAWKLFDPMHVEAHSQLQSAGNEDVAGNSLVSSIATAMCEMGDTAEMATLWTEIMQEVESHWASGRALPDASPAAVTEPVQSTPLHTCLMSINAALALREGSIHSAQAAGEQVTAQQGSQALDSLRKMSPRQIFEQLFRVQACVSLSEAEAMAGKADDAHVLLSGVREVEHLTHTALSQPVLSKHQLTKLCQVFNKLEVMFQVASEQSSLRQQTQQQAAWLATASQQDVRAASPSSDCSADQNPTWSDLGYESWTLL